MKLGPVSATIAGLGFGAAGGVLFHFLGVPLGYIIGAMVGGAIASNLVGRPRYTRYLRRVGQLIVGTAVGAVLTAPVVAELARLFPLMIAAAVLANLAGLLLAWPLARIVRTDRTTALLAALPAGMAEMASLARDLGANEQVVAVVHTLRVTLVVVSIPLILGIDGGARASGPAAAPADPGEWATLMLVALLGAGTAYAMARAGLLNPWVVMPMVAGLLVVLAGFPIPPMPPPLLIAAQILIGVSLGARIRMAELAALPRAALGGILSALALIAIMVLAVVPLLRPLAGVGHDVLVLALAPGGLGEMIASAKALGVAAATVAGFQFVRSLSTNMLAPVLIRRWTRRRQGRGSGGG
jgi:hypothetical protein